MKRVLSFALAFLFLLSALLSCTPSDTPVPTDTPATTETATPTPTAPEEEINLLTKKGESLFNATYQTMLDRTQEDGYAQTSLTGAYTGMFVRDASIQVMAHLATGDYEQAEKLLRYMVGYHTALKAQHTVHIMGTLTESAWYDGVLGDMSQQSKETLILQENSGVGLYLINAPGNRSAQTFKAAFDSVREIDVYMGVGGNAGTVTLMLGTDVDDDSLGTVERDIADLQNGWVSFEFDDAVALTVGETYYFTVVAEDATANIIVYGETNGKNASHNYDEAAYGGWVKSTNSFAYRVRKNTEEQDTTAEDEEYVQKHCTASVAVGKTEKKAQAPATPQDGSFVTGAELFLSRKGSAGGQYTVTLYCDGTAVGSVSRAVSTLSAEPARVHFDFPLPITYPAENCVWSVGVTAEEEGGVLWYGESADRLSVRVGTTAVKAASEKEQVDGNYMFVNAYAMYCQLVGETAFVKESYPLVRTLANYYMENGYWNEENGLMYDPNYEHSRDGRYWQAYDLVTCVFTAEAWHKFAAVATTLGHGEDAKRFAKAADALSDAINENLTCEYHGKTIYTELIDVEHDDRLYKGFSFVSLAPIAADWYAVDAEIMANTYAAYLECTEKYGKYAMLPVVVELDENDNVKGKGNHVIGKGLAWEILYLGKTGNIERLEQMLAFVDSRSKTTYPEVWVDTGSVNDSANQEQASWMLYEIARMVGKNPALEGLLTTPET